MRRSGAAAMVLAGGNGSRFGAGRNKVYLPLAGRSVLSWSLNTMASVPGIGPLVLVARPGDRELVDELLAAEVPHPVEVVDGGDTRQASELCGLRHLAERIIGELVDTVLIHDGARPLVSARLVGAVLAEARRAGAAIPGVPCVDLARATPDGQRLLGTAPAGLIATQTPQGFAAAPLLAAYEQAAGQGWTGTDTASCMQRFSSTPVRWIPGEERNIKITYGHDLELAEAVLSRRADPERG